MPIEIIGAGRDAAEAKKLPSPPVENLPAPKTAKEAQRVLDIERLVELSKSEHELLRRFAAGKLMRTKAEAAGKALVDLLEDENPDIQETALRALSDREVPNDLDAVARAFERASGSVAAQAARTLAKRDPARLVAAVKARSRLDDEAYAITTAELARSEDEEALAYLRKAMDRAGAQSAQRRAALYASALLSGADDLTKRVVGMAISDSTNEDPEYGSSPARTALASLGGLPAALASSSVGEELMRDVRGDETLGSQLTEGVKDAAEDALKKNNINEILAAIAPIVDVEPRGDVEELRSSIVRRRKSLLRSLVEHREKIASLSPKAGAIFAFVALDAAKMLSIAAHSPAESPALEQLGKILESSGEALVALAPDALEAKLKETESRVMRRVALALATEAFYDPKTLERFLRAILRAGHGEQLVDALADARSEGFAQSVLSVFEEEPQRGEEAVYAVLDRRPLDEGPTMAALALASRVATERLSLLIGRRFEDLRDVARIPLAEAMYGLGDARLAPIVESRAFEDEPEELAWVLLSLIGGSKVEGKLERALKRWAEPADDGKAVHMPLRCKACKETLSYGFAGVWVDPGAQSNDGDPAYVGDVKCKACGTEDELETTPEAVQVMSESMLAFLRDAQAGVAGSAGVLPRTTKVLGPELGFAEALRRVDKEVETSPDSIRFRLRRGRLRLLLQRSNAIDDIRRALEIDERSLEAKLLLAGHEAQTGDLGASIASLAEILKGLREDSPRLYEGEQGDLIREVEDSLLEMESGGADLPADLDLDAARDRLAKLIEERTQRLEQAQQQQYADAMARRRAALGDQATPAFVKGDG